MRGRAAATLLAGVVLALAAACGGSEAHPFRIGVLADCYGGFSGAHDAIIASAELPLLERGAKLRGPKPTDGVGRVDVAHRPVELLQGCVSGNEDVIPEARRLVEEQGAALIVGPLDPQQGMVLRDYARRRPQTTFLIQPSDAPELTLANPAPNVFRFVADAAQDEAGLGSYAYHTLGWRTIVTIGDNVPYGWDSVSGFVAEFCALGGRVVKQLWPEYGADSPALVRRLPSADGVYLGTVFPPLGFIKRYAAAHADLGQRLVGNATMLFFLPPAAAKGVVFGGQMPFEPTPAVERYLASFKRAFPRLRVASALNPLAIPIRDGVEAALDALERAKGSGPRFRAELARLVLRSPTGLIRLDRNRQAIVNAYLSRVGTDAKVKTLRVVPNVEQTFAGYFTADSPPAGPTRQACRKATPPPWAR